MTCPDCALTVPHHHAKPYVSPALRPPVAVCPEHGWEACMTRDGRCWVCALVQASEKRCEHEWMDFGGPGDEWRECFLCGRQEDQ